MVLDPFKHWGMDIVGTIKPLLQGKKHILVCIDYITKWVEVCALV